MIEMIQLSSTRLLIIFPSQECLIRSALQKLLGKLGKMTSDKLIGMTFLG